MRTRRWGSRILARISDGLVGGEPADEREHEREDAFDELHRERLLGLNEAAASDDETMSDSAQGRVRGV